MAKRVLVDIDLAVLGANMSREEGRTLGENEVRQWLLDAGFKPQGGLWLVNERDLGQLDPSEVKSLIDAPGGG